MINTDVPIVFLPMHKSLKHLSGNSARSSTDSSVLKNSDAQALSPEKKGTIACALPEVKPKKKSKKKKTQESKNKNKAKKKSAEKKVIEVEKKVEEKPKLEPEKKTEIKMPEQISENISLAATPSNADNQNVLYVGQQEMDALQMQDYIQQEMAQHWSPPAGMRKNISCIIKVMIGFDGAVTKIDVEESSGVLIFDGAAKRAAAQLTPPQWALGKEIILTFKP